MLGCGSSDSGSGPDLDGGPDLGGGDKGTNLVFNIKDASSLQAVEKIVKSIDDRSASGLFTYKILNGNSREAVTSGTNLMAVDENGSTSLALTSNLPIKVMYSAVNPKDGLVYLALDYTWTNGVDFQQVIANENCAFYEVNPKNNQYKCVSEGKLLQKYDDNYMKMISGNQKPIQFDDNGDVYFLATDFTRNDYGYCDNSTEPKEACEANGGVWKPNYSIINSNWNPRLYKYKSKTSKLEAITQDNVNVEFFATLSTGDVVYQSKTTGVWSKKLMMKKADSARVINLTNDIWGVDFFTIDTKNTVLFGQNDWSGSGEDGIRIVKSGSKGIKKTTLNTSKFGQNKNHIWNNPKPRRIIVADDGKIYGVFESGHNVYDTTGNYEWKNTLNVYQVLPFDPIPKVQLKLKNNNWWSWMEDTPFQISKGFLYYKETKQDVTVEGESLGSGDFIKVVDLNTRKITTILEPSKAEDVIYEIYKWKLSGDKLYFSALNKINNIVVTATIDTAKVKQGANKSEYLSIKESASARGAISKIQDIEILKPIEPEIDTASKPSIVDNGISMNPENQYSISIEFSKYMDTDSIIKNLKLKSNDVGEGQNTDGIISYIPIWVYKTLHIIPDLSSGGLGDSESVGLSNGKEYTLEFGSGIKDKYGWDFNIEHNKTVAMSPDKGWYVGASDSVDTSLTKGKVIKFADLKDKTQYAPENYLLNDLNNTKNFRVQFSAKNFEYSLGDIILRDTGNNTPNLLSISVSSSIYISYRDKENDYKWDTKYKNTIANGNWKIYRLDVYGNTVKFSVSKDGVKFDEIISKTDLRPSTATTNYKLLFGAKGKVAMDNLIITTLGNDGNVSSEVGNIIKEDFTDFNISDENTNPNFKTTYTSN
jgi:hypothetical protein